MADPQQDSWVVASEAPAASTSQPKAAADAWEVQSEAPATAQAAQAPQQPATAPAQAPAPSPPPQAPATPPASTWTQQHPILSKFLPDPTTDDYKQLSQHIGQSDMSGEIPRGGAGADIVDGSGSVAHAAKMDFAHSHGNPLASDLSGRDKAERNKAAFGGATELLGGIFSADMAASAPELLHAGIAAVGGNKAAQVAIAKVAGHFGIGAGASEVAGKIADHFQATPETKALVQSLAFFLPSVAGMAGIKAGTVNANGVKGAGVSAFDGAVAAKAGMTPDHFGASVKVGNTQVGVKIPRPQTGMTVADPVAQVEAQKLLDQGVSTMKAADQTEAAAKAVVAGATPEQAIAAQQPPTPPTPADQAAAQMFPDPVIQQHHLDAAATLIKSLPETEQGAALLEAHNQLAGQIAKWGSFTGPDRKVYTVKNPADATKFASQFLNAEVDKHDDAAQKAQDDAQKAQDDAAKAAKATSPAKGDGDAATSPEDQLYQRAKTLIESNPEQIPVSTLQRHLGIGYGEATRMVERYRAEQVPTVGGEGQKVVEEKPATIDAQMESLKAGTIKAVMLPAGSTYTPEIPPGFKTLEVKDGEGAGTYIYKVGAIKPQTIKEAARAGTHGDLMGHVETKASMEGKPTVAVVAQKPDGTEIQASEVTTPDAAQRQAEILAERHPGAQIVAKPIDDVIEARLAEPANEGEKWEAEKEEPAPAAAAAEPEAKGGEWEVANEKPAETTTSVAENPPAKSEEAPQNATSVPEISPAEKSSPAEESSPAKFQTGPHDKAMSSTMEKATLKRLRKGDLTRPVNDLHGKPTGWTQHNGMDAITLVHPTEDRVVQFKPKNSKSGTELQRAGAEAQAYAIDNPVTEQAEQAQKTRVAEEKKTKAEITKKTAETVATAQADDAGWPERRDAARKAAEGRFREPYDEMLYHALNSFDRGADRWSKLRKTGATDAEMLEAVRKEMGTGGMGQPHGDGYETRGDKFYFQPKGESRTSINSKLQPTLQGAKTVAAARRILDIGKPGAAAAAAEPKYSFGNTQAHIAKGSDADKAIDKLRALIPKSALAGKGKDLDENHVTVRYGIKGDDTAKIREYLKSQAPFEAKLGATEMFQPSKSSDGAAVIQAPVDSPDLHRMNAEIEKHGDFEPSSFPDYKPHVTVAYVKPDLAKKYVGMKGSAGKSFRVDSIAISDRNGNSEEVKLEGKPPAKVTPQVAAPAGTKYVLPSFVTAQYAKPEETGTKPEAAPKVDETSTLAKSEETGGKAEAAPVATGGGTLTEHFVERIRAGAMPKDNNALRKLVEAFDGKPVDNHRLKQGQEALEAAIVDRSREIVEIGHGHASTRDTFDRLVKLYESQPNLNIRTSTSMQHQAYSTPAPMAYLASKLAGITPESTVYEPTAGNGMLLIGATPSLTQANELQGERAAALKKQGFKVTTKDATTFTPPAKFDAVIANPPFGSVKGEDGKTSKVSVDGYKIGQIDHLIAAKALDAMADDGKATLILGASKVTGGISKDDRLFFNWLYSHYRVASHFEVEGDLYARQGAGWPVRIITVDGRERSDKFTPEEGAIERAGTWKEVYERFDQSLAAQQQRDGAVSPERSVQRPGDGSAAVHPPSEKPVVAADRKRSRGGKGSSDGIGRAEPRSLPDSEIESAPGLASTDNDVRPDADAARSDRLPEGRKRDAAAKRDAKPRGDRGSDLADPENAFQVQYTPASSKKDEGVLIPTNMRDPLGHALASLEDRVGDLDKYLVEQLGYKDTAELHNALMGLQVDSVASAIDQMSRGKAVIIADQTGIGKGRQAAAIIRWAVKQGKIPVFMTVKPQLFTDMYGDLADIGTDDVRPLLMNVDESISLPDGSKVFANQKSKHSANLQKIVQSGDLPDNRNAVFLTYSQINTDNTQRKVLARLASKAILVMDESHNAAGESSTGEYMQSLLKNISGVTYLSATYAKRPDNMPLYSKTDIGLAIKDKQKLEEAMAMGGLPLQTVVANNLVKGGQMFRRERSYDGVDIATKVDTGRSAEHAELADKVTHALRGIVRADKAFHKGYAAAASKAAKKGGKTIQATGNKASSTVEHSEFTAVVHNFVRQMLLALKADSAADEAIAAIKRGEKPLIAVEQTMGSFLNEYAASKGLGDGDKLGDFSYRTVLERALERTRGLKLTDERGNESHKWVPLADLDLKTRTRYNEAQDIIDALDVDDLPMSPIDWMRDRLTKAGHSIAEITGRNLAVDYTDPKVPKLSSVSAEEQNDKVATTRKFNSGKLDAILLNVAGSTGISLHASEKFTDQRQRHMIVAQPAQDINVFMQMLGRIHRTGQVKLPRYTILSVDLPSEKRPTALLAKKMKSLNANTSSNTESATSVKAADMLNKYGDEIVGRYLHENPELEKQLGVDGMASAEQATTDVARTATGKLALLPVEAQKQFYSDVEQQYGSYIDYLNETGQNDLEPRTVDYDAKDGKQQILVKGKNPDSPFGQDAIYNEFSVKPQTKPLTPDEVKATILKNMGEEKMPARHAEEIFNGLDGQFQTWLDKLPEDSPQRNSGALARQVARNFLMGHRLGSTLRLEIKGDTFSAAVTNLSSSHKGTGNPFALSKVEVELATNGAIPRMKVPGTQLLKITLAHLNEPVLSLFQKREGDGARETAKVITGNLLGAYGELKDTKGSIINFSKADGTIEQGILLPKKFDLKENTVGDYQFTEANHILAYLHGLKGDEGKLVGVSSRDGDVRLTMANGKLFVTTHKSKARGARFFLDKPLTDLTGDFVSVGNMMRAEVPAAKAEAVVDRLLAKTGLYVPRSQADEAVWFEGKQPPPVPKSSSGGSVTMRSSLFGVDLLWELGGKVVKAAWKADIAPHLPALGENAREIRDTVTHLLAPRVGANPDVLDSMMRLKGDKEKAMYAVDQVFKGTEKMFDRLPVQDRIDFLDRYKTGQTQATPELEQIADMYHALDDRTYRAIIDAQVGGMDRSVRKVWDRLSKTEKEAFYTELSGAREFALKGDAAKAAGGDKDAKERLTLQKIADGSLAFKDNHLRAFWKVIPGSLEERSPDRTKRGPLRGDRGMTKRSTLPDVSTGMADGGVLVTDNPQKLVEMGQSSSWRYVTALNMWKELGDLGMRKFVRFGERAPDGWERINDSIGKVFFPAESGEGVIQAGEWHVEQTAARLLNNYLSKNWFQTNAVGKGLLFVKNVSTGLELALSPFHFVFESVESMSSQFGLGLMQTLNQGIGEGDGKAFLAGLGKMATAPVAPVNFARAGGKAIRMAADTKTFLADPANKRFLESFPNAPHLVDLYFTGGGTLSQPREFRVSLMESAAAAMKDGNYLGAFARAVPGLSEAVMKPLFETYIPRLKLGFFLEAMSQQMAEKHDALMRGDVTEAQIARDVVDSTENRFGELNFSNLFWNNTFKGAMQLGFRSVTWKLGNWRGAVTGIKGQAEKFADPLRAIHDDFKGYRKGQKRKPGDYIPKLDLNLSWLLGMIATSAVMGTIFTKLKTGRYPWEYVNDDKARGMGGFHSLALEMIHPRTGGTDGYTGLPTRISLPSGLRDFEHATEDQGGYLHGSESGMVGKVLDTWDNRDFFGNYVYDPNGTMYQKFASIMAYNMPQPITVQTFRDAKRTGDYTRAELGLVGLSKAPSYLDQTPLEKHLEGIHKAKHVPETPMDHDLYQDKMRAIRAGEMTGREARKQMKQYQKPYIVRLFESDRLNYFEAKHAYTLANEQEKQILRPLLQKKRAAALRRDLPGTKEREAAAAD